MVQAVKSGNMAAVEILLLKGAEVDLKGGVRVVLFMIIIVWIDNTLKLTSLLICFCEEW